MSLTDIKQEIKQFLDKSFKINHLEDSQDIFDTGIVHSLFFVQLLIFIEKKFKIELNPDEFDITSLRTIDSISQLVLNKTGIPHAAE